MTATLTRETRWECPNCDLTDLTHDPRPHTRFHHCPRLGLTAPMVRAGTHAKVETVPRQDYIGSDLVRCDDRGRPVSAVVTTTDLGRDVIAFAGCPTVKVTWHAHALDHEGDDLAPLLGRKPVHTEHYA